MLNLNNYRGTFIFILFILNFNFCKQKRVISLSFLEILIPNPYSNNCKSNLPISFIYFKFQFVSKGKEKKAAFCYFIIHFHIEDDRLALPLANTGYS